MDEAKLKEKRERLNTLNEQRSAERLAKQEEMLAPFKANLPAQEVLDALQYRHDPFYGKTYAVVSPTPEDLFGAMATLLANQPALIPCKVGVGKLNAYDKDQYSKYVGRTVSAGKLQDVSVSLEWANVGKDQTTFNTRLGDVSFIFMLTHGKLKPFLQDVYHYGGQEPYSEKVKQIRSRK